MHFYTIGGLCNKTSKYYENCDCTGDLKNITGDTRWLALCSRGQKGILNKSTPQADVVI